MKSLLLPEQSLVVEFSERPRIRSLLLPGQSLVVEISERPRMKSVLLLGQSLVVEFSERLVVTEWIRIEIGIFPGYYQVCS